jgi:hypothetical protein
VPDIPLHRKQARRRGERIVDAEVANQRGGNDMAKISRGGRMTAAKGRAAKSPGGKGLVKDRPAGKNIMRT